MNIFTRDKKVTMMMMMMMMMTWKVTRLAFLK